MDVYPVDYTTDVGRVRKYIPDIEQMEDPRDPLIPPSFIWSDEAIQSFIDDEAEDVNNVQRTAIWRAAAQIMIATANNENLILKKIVTEDLQTDGPAVAKALIAAAQELRNRANRDDALVLNAETFTIVPYAQAPTPYFLEV